MTAVLFVSEIATNVCWTMERPAIAPTSWATGPLASVPVDESPYNKVTTPPAGLIFAEGYGGMSVFWHTEVLHASDTTQRSLDPVSRNNVVHYTL